MKIKLAFASLLAALSLSTSALADVVNAGTIPVSPADPFSHVFTHAPGAFFDSVNFDIVAPQLGSSANPLVLTLNNVDVFAITELSYELWDNDHPNGVISFGTFSGNDTTYTIMLSSPGSYHIDFSGNATGVAGGVYGVALITAVPEPETYALLLAGIGCLLVVSRRRGKTPPVDSTAFA